MISPRIRYNFDNIAPSPPAPPPVAGGDRPRVGPVPAGGDPLDSVARWLFDGRASTVSTWLGVSAACALMLLAAFNLGWVNGRREIERELRTERARVELYVAKAARMAERTRLDELTLADLQTRIVEYERRKPKRGKRR